MFKYVKHTNYPINIKKKDVKMAKYLITQFGGSNGELAAAMRYFSQKFNMPDEKGKAMLFSYPKRKLYEICLETNNFVELKIQFDIEELKAHEPGFCRSSEQLRYCCHENAFNSIRNFLDGSTIGNQFDRESEIELYKEVISNSHGTCGEEVHAFMSKL